MNIISTTIEFKGIPVKIENGNVFLRAFGTTISNQKMHWSWIMVEKKDLSKELFDLLIEKKMI